MTGVVVTGGSGKAGRAAIRELVARGYRVMNVDLAPPSETLCHFLKADLNDMGQTVDALRRAMGTVERRRPFEVPDAVIHMAGIPAPGLAPDVTTFQNNLMSTYNVFSAATLVGVRKVVWASSETLFGLPFTREAPVFAPITEEHPSLPESGYALAKGLSEEMARQMHRWNPGTAFLGLRISNVIEPHEYPMFESWQDNPDIRKWNLWSYIDSRDVGLACRLALDSDMKGAEHCIIAANDTVMRRPNAQLLSQCFPTLKLSREVGANESLQSSDRAHALFGYRAQHSWRDQA